MEDELVLYVTHGEMTAAGKLAIQGMTPEERQELSEKLQGLDAQELTEGEITRFGWISGQLGRTAINPTTFDRMVVTVSEAQGHIDLRSQVFGRWHSGQTINPTRHERMQ